MIQYKKERNTEIGKKQKRNGDNDESIENCGPCLTDSVKTTASTNDQRPELLVVGLTKRVGCPEEPLVLFCCMYQEKR